MQRCRLQGGTCEMKAWRPVAVSTCQSGDVEMTVPTATTACPKYDAEMSSAELSGDISEGEASTTATEGGASVAATEGEAIEEEDTQVVRTSEKFMSSLGIVLSQWVEEAAANAGAPQNMGCFHSVKAPPMAIVEYLERIRKYYRCSNECFVMALVYIDRVSKTDPSMKVCDLTVHRLLMISVMLAAKFHDDLYFGIDYYSKVGGLRLQETRWLESTMLKMLDWKMNVSIEEYELYHSLVCRAASPGDFGA